MKKRLFAFLLAVCLFLLSVPEAGANGSVPLQEALARQFDNYAASVYQAECEKDALLQLLEPAISGGENPVCFGPEEPVAATVLNAALFRTYLLEALPQFLEYMDAEGLTRLLAGGDVGWHDYTLDYHARVYEWNDTPDADDDRELAHLFYRQNVSCETNACDDFLAFLVGTARVRLQIEKRSDLSYRLNITVSDDFNFDGNYDEEKDQGFDTGTSDQLNNLGNQLGLHSFTWYADAGFDLLLSDPIPGDITGDGKADYADALQILRASIGLAELTESQKQIADINGDGNPDYIDALTILRRSIGLEEIAP